MDSVVVFESLWGNTAAVARAIAQGLGDDAQALSTAEATPAALEGVTLLVCGAPVHALSLPSESTRESARARPQGEQRLMADLSHPAMREWLAHAPPGPGMSAAFDTRIRGPLGHGASAAIARGLAAAGWRAIDPPRGFTVRLKTTSSEAAALLVEGELDAAREWGARLAELAREHAPRSPS